MESIKTTADLVSTARIRPAVMDDAQAICSLYNFYVKSSTASFSLKEETLEERRNWLLSHETQGMPVLVADLGDRVIAFASISPYHSHCGYASTVELSIYIDPVCVGKGLGKVLLDRLIELAYDRYHALVALICSENESSIKLFASRDFAVVGELKEVGYKFDRYLDVTFMERLIKPSKSS